MPLVKTIDTNSPPRSLLNSVRHTIQMTNNQYTYMVAPIEEGLFKHTWVDDFYPNRPVCLNDISLFKLVSQFEHTYMPCDRSGLDIPHTNCYQLNNGLGHIHKLNVSNIIKVRAITIINDATEQQYFKQILTLFAAWRSKQELLFGRNNYFEAYEFAEQNLLIDVCIINVFFKDHSTIVRNLEIEKMDRLTEDSLFEHHLNEDSGIGNDYD